MLVKAKSDIQDYGPVTRLKKDHLYIVYAIEKKTGSNGQDRYAVFPFGMGRSKVLQLDIDPLYFDSDLFDIETDLVSNEWITKTVPVAHGETTISSFKEWFDNEFYIRAHDWDLRGEDYDTMKQYWNKYENTYHKYIQGSPDGDSLDKDRG